MVRIQSTRAFALRTPGAPLDAIVLCDTRAVHGRVVRVLADTAVLDITSALRARSTDTPAGESCPSRGEVAVIVGDGFEVATYRFDAGKTAFRLTLVAIVVGGLLAWVGAALLLR